MATQSKKNWTFIIGILIMCVGMQLANYGVSVAVAGEVNAMGAGEYYSLISAFGSMGMMLILPVVGRLTGILGQRNMIIYGIIIQALGRVGMMLMGNWVGYAAFNLLQSVGGGFYVSAAYVNMTAAVEPEERPKYFGYIAVANAVGAICGPILVSAMYSMGGIMAKLSYVANLPFTLIGLAMIYSACDNVRSANAMKGFDYAGLTLSVVGLGSMVLWLNLAGKMFTWGSVPSLILGAVGIVSLVLMVKQELKVENPAVPIRMFRNPRMTYAFIGGLTSAAYATCSGAYCTMWIRMNFSQTAGATFYNGTATMAQQIVIFVLGLFLGGYVAKKFVRRFRIFGIASMAAAVLATGMLYCLKFTGTAAAGNLVMLGSVPAGMILIYAATAVGGFTSVVAQSTFSAFWQTNTPKEDFPSGQALYTFAGSGGSVIFGAVAGVVLGASQDYSRAFATGCVFAIVGLICSIVGFRFTKEEMKAAQ